MTSLHDTSRVRSDLIIMAAEASACSGDLPLTAVHVWFSESFISGGYPLVDAAEAPRD